MTDFELINDALNARKNSYSPYSGFSVGAALLCSDGNVYTGCNVEVSTFSPTICAERNAIFKAVSEGRKDFVKIAIVGGKRENDIPEKICRPCGVCRQVMSEFCGGDFEIIMAKTTDEFEKKTLSELLPGKFELTT